MAIKQYDRVGTTTDRITNHLALLIKKEKLDGKNSNGDELIKVDAKRQGRIVRVDYSPDVKDKHIKRMQAGLTSKYGLVSGPTKKGSYVELFVGTQLFGENMTYMVPTAAYALIMMATSVIFVIFLRKRT